MGVPGGDRAYKLKKPLVLGFLDYGTPERRREMCREEVRLNRWLAPDVYLSVRAVAATRAAFELVLAAILIYTPVFQRLLATAALDPDMLLFVAPFPFVVWGADELRRWALRRRDASDATGVRAN